MTRYRSQAHPDHFSWPLFILGWTLAIIGACLVATAFVWVAFALLTSLSHYVPTLP
jgi:hypothetical protein